MPKRLRRTRRAGQVAHGDNKNAYKILVKKPEQKRPHGMDLDKVGQEEGVDWVNKTQDRNSCGTVLNIVRNCQVP